MCIILWRFAHNWLPTSQQFLRRHILTSRLHCSAEECVEHSTFFFSFCAGGVDWCGGVRQFIWTVSYLLHIKLGLWMSCPSAIVSRLWCWLFRFGTFWILKIRSDKKTSVVLMSVFPHRSIPMLISYWCIYHQRIPTIIVVRPARYHLGLRRKVCSTWMLMWFSFLRPKAWVPVLLLVIFGRWSIQS
jgi:hypothetical protein